MQETQGAKINPILTGPGIDERYARDDNGGRTYFLTDALGSTRLLTDTNGNAVQRYDYDPYGATTQSSTSYNNPYQYTGREHDQSGLYYYRARYYMAELGRFISEDPLQLAAGPNSYAYVGSNPISFIDPYGLEAVIAPPIPYLPPWVGEIDGILSAGPGGVIVGALWPSPMGAPSCEMAGNFAACINGAYNKPPKDAADPNGAKAPGKPGDAEGYCPSKKGDRWVQNPNGSGSGWEDANGDVWVPSGPGGVQNPNGSGSGWEDANGDVWVPSGPGGSAHGGPHWDVQTPGGGYINVYPGGRRR
ncbi:RHS repeat-associated core domain-containing protein [Xanthomonas sp. MUS 060]|uniref:polymorphic toxin type 37 domain-containing protein n=1 Tax=Xanthomonas sp. MUS 060 TaxID=1588031 RepID=UPI001F397308|nr:RHS repeat-associated core domain-containing protein [Xanthomonas sp. MUS 060]